MDRKNFQYFEMLTRVVEFGEAHLDLFPKSTLAEKTFAQLGAALSNVSEHAGSQVTSRNSVHARTKARDAAHHALRAQLRRLSDTARAIAIDTPGVDEQFRMPDRKRAQALLLGAKAFSDAAGPFKKEFVQHGMPDGFIDDLNEAANGLEAAIQEQASNKTKRASTGKALNDNLAECLKLLIRLDAMVKNTLVDNEPVLTEWKTARRVRRVSSRSSSPQPKPLPPTHNELRARSSEQQSEPVKVVLGELSGFDLKPIVPVSVAEPLQHVPITGQKARFPLHHHVKILMHHQDWITEEVLRTAAQIDTSPTRCSEGVPVQPSKERVFDHLDAGNILAEECHECDPHGLR